jgi:hypothetical protein
VAELRIQNPGDDGGYLLEALLESCTGADSGGGIFAWATRSGSAALLDDPTFIEFLKDGTFELIVGTDSITDEPAVEVLALRDEQLPTLSIRAFVHDETALFHPKMAWFVAGRQLTLIVGSGNLTLGGTRGNWEAFSIATLRGSQARAAEAQIRSWLSEVDRNLLPLAHPRVQERAKRNTGRERDFKRLRKISPPTPVPPSEALEVLVAEIPKAGDRWSQANFDLANYEGFFGAKAGTQRRIALYHVEGDGSLGGLESRPSVEVKSQNYRFELAAAKGRPYPDDGPPIGAFVRLDTGIFIYELLLPGDGGYDALAKFLHAEWSGRADRMRRVRTTVDKLRSRWPDAPLWKASTADL